MIELFIVSEDFIILGIKKLLEVLIIEMKFNVVVVFVIVWC